MATKLFFGYDPGGRADGQKEGNNGVVAAHIGKCGTVSRLDSCRLRDASGVIAWFGEKISQEGAPVALGIDTLLAWSLRGVRACDAALGRQYPGPGILPQNFLMGAMALNGVLVAKYFPFPGVPLVESHPKLLKRVLRQSPDLDPAGGALFAAIERFRERKGDHEEDALIAAWCASRWHFGSWQMNLYKIPEIGRELHYPVGNTVYYPWPEEVPPAE